jgi:hypothetical protein
MKLRVNLFVCRALKTLSQEHEEEGCCLQLHSAALLAVDGRYLIEITNSGITWSVQETAARSVGALAFRLEG